MLRADFGPIIVRRGANVQDGSVLHGGADPVTEVGEGATIGHLCVVHGGVIGAEALIGNGATVLDGAVIGSRALVPRPRHRAARHGRARRHDRRRRPRRIAGEVTGGARSGSTPTPRCTAT